ncbi:hypothetical protein [Microbispora sitophila]|nr:hypothetical protein [Microbispora sitophila]
MTHRRDPKYRLIGRTAATATDADHIRRLVAAAEADGFEFDD